MYKILRIIFSILAAIAAAAAIFIFVYFGWMWGLVSVGVCIVFAGLMVLFKQLQEKKELKENPPPPKGDFITGRVPENKDENKE